MARIAAFTALFTYLYHLSHQASLARGNPEVPGMLWAIGVVTGLFTIRAIVTEWASEAPSTPQKDFLWSLSASGIITIVARNLSA